MRRMLSAVLVALPSLVLAGAGLVHPLVLTPATAHHWWTMHVWLLPVFPLLAVALLWLLRGTREPWAWLARVAAYGYATGYTALDVLAGIGAGLVVDDEGHGSATAARLIGVADDIGLAGSICFLVAALLTAALAWPAGRWWAVAAGLLLLDGGWLFLGNHIFAPRGVAGQLVIALGLATLAVAGRTSVRPASG